MFSKSEAGFRRLLPLLRPHTKQLFTGGACMLVYVICWPFLAYLAGELTTAIGEVGKNTEGSLEKVGIVIFIALVVFIIQKLAQFGQDIILAKPALKISQDLRTQLFGQLQKIELKALEKLSSGDIAYRLTEDADRVGEVIYKTIQDTTPCIFQLVAVFGYMVYLDWQLSISILIIAPIITLLVSGFGMKVLIAAEKSQKQVSELAGLLNEAIQGIPLVRAFAAENWLQGRFDREVELHREARYKTLRLLALQHPVIGFIEASGILLVLGIGAARIQSGGLDGQSFSTYITGLLMLIDPISHLTTNFNEFQQGQASLKRLRAIEKEPIEDNYISSPEIIKEGIGEIFLSDITFGYKEDEIIFNNLSLKIEKGKVTALVGPSGGGKSTIFGIILRFLKPKNGEILFDSVNIDKLDTYKIRRNIGFVPQRSIVFSGSIKDAITLGRSATDQEIITAAKIANAHGFISKLSKGYETRLDERATNISGGQLQRIAIARALLTNPAVLLLDEATSALDAEAESAVQLALKQAMNKRTVLIIAHRLSTVQESDKIIVLEKGEIVDTGSHDELINKKGRYRELCEKQFIRQTEDK